MSHVLQSLTYIGHMIHSTLYQIAVAFYSPAKITYVFTSLVFIYSFTFSEIHMSHVLQSLLYTNPMMHPTLCIVAKEGYTFQPCVVVYRDHILPYLAHRYHILPYTVLGCKIMTCCPALYLMQRSNFHLIN